MAHGLHWLVLVMCIRKHPKPFPFEQRDKGEGFLPQRRHQLEEFLFERGSLELIVGESRGAV